MPASSQQVFRHIFIFGCLCLVTAACEPDVITRGDFYYLNSSGFDVVIERFDVETDTTISLEIFEIKKTREHKRRVDFEGPDNIACEDFQPPVGADSIAITYSDGRVASFNLKDTSSSNPLLLRNYSSVKIAQNFCEFRFTIK